MWVDYRKAPNLMTAEMWKDVLEGDGLPTKIIPEGDILTWGERVPFRILVPRGRLEHFYRVLRAGLNVLVLEMPKEALAQRAVDAVVGVAASTILGLGLGEAVEGD